MLHREDFLPHVVHTAQGQNPWKLAVKDFNPKT
jgi:hypothetical protein